MAAQCDTYAARIKVLERELTEARAALNEVNRIDFWRDKESPWLKAQIVAWLERHAVALRAARGAK
jgi:hypothetical protein